MSSAPLVLRRVAVLAHQLCVSEGELRRSVQLTDTIRVGVTGIIDGNPKVPAKVFQGDAEVFVAGDANGLLQPALDEACRGLHQGEMREFMVRPGDPSHPQSERDEKLVVSLPTGGEAVAVGNLVRVRHQGRFRLATVVAVLADTATVDMNDPLAGKTLRMRAVLEGFDADDEKLRRMFPAPEHIGKHEFTLAELAKHKGQRAGDSVLISVRGYVYDVTDGIKFYGPSGAYGWMAGSDATVALAKFSMDPQLLNRGWEMLSAQENQQLATYVSTMRAKYPAVGTLKAQQLRSPTDLT